ncbi:carboxylate--amine ligase [Demequina sp.]|uniref:carboxylate--amine ligase n=1 Tax=Demequina sp. TaxID=2050685 RepID=UPI003D0B432B
MAAPFAHLVEGKNLLPVILGGDIGGYSLARAFHEAFGVKSIIMSTALGGTVRDSAIVINVVEPGMDSPEVAVAALKRIAAAHPGAALIAMGSADWLVRILVENREQLPEYVVPYVDKELLDRVTSKEAFAELCVEYGLAHPRTVVVSLGSGVPDAGAGLFSELTFPVVAKAADSGAFHAVEFAGKEKVAYVASPAELVDLLGRVVEAGYRDAFIVQDFIPGDDAGLRIFNTYCSSAGAVEWTVYGHVLLQEHTPSTVGNSSIVLTEPAPAAIEPFLRLLEGIGWRGFASPDMKVDPRTGELVFFELNPRLSRSNYFVTASGVNPAVAYVRDWLLGLPPSEEECGGPQKQAVFTVVPRWIMDRYVIDADIRARVKALRRSGSVKNPLWNPAERHPRRLAYVAAHQLNQIRKYRTFYPRSVQAAEREAIEGMPFPRGSNA